MLFPNITKKINIDRLKRVSICVIVVCIIAHGFVYFNEQFSHDSIALMFNTDSITMISFGRFLRPIYNMLKGYFCYPTLNGLLSVLYLIIISYLIIDIFDIDDNILIFFIAAVICTNYSISLLYATYMHDSDAYIFSLMLSTIAVWLFIKNKKGIVVSILLFTASLAIYQSYIGFAIFLFLIYFINKIIKEGINKENFKTLVFFGIVIITSMVLYYISFKIVLSLLNIGDLESYQNPSNVLNFNLNSIRERINTFTNSLYKWFILPRGNHRNWVAAINKLVLLIDFVLIINLFISNKNNIQTILMVFVMILACPIGMNIIALISNVFHDLTIFPFNFFYITPLILLHNSFSLNSKVHSAIGLIICLLLTVLVYDNCLYSNEIYLKKDLESKTTLMTMTRIIDRIEQTDGYVLGETPVMFVGTLNASDYGIRREGFDYTATGLSNTFSISYPGVYSAYIKQYLNYPMNLIYNEDVINNILNDEKIQNMPCFPNRGGG